MSIDGILGMHVIIICFMDCSGNHTFKVAILQNAGFKRRDVTAQKV